jgi:hypothetical protein
MVPEQIMHQYLETTYLNPVVRVVRFQHLGTILPTATWRNFPQS